MKNTLSTQPYKGTMDFLPEDMAVRNRLFNIWADTAREFGYEEYDTPLLEEVSLYKAKSGDEIANTQLYNFVDKGGREVAIRPEMTPSLARVIAGQINVLPKPIRWFNIGKYYRYEKPQRGRLREFFQLNIDVFGVTGVEAELEIFQFVDAVMKKLGASQDTYKIFVNNRYLLDYLFAQVLGLDDEAKKKVGRAIDNFPKMTVEDFSLTLKDLGLSQKQIDDTLEFLKTDIEGLKKLADKSDGAKQLVELFEKAEKIGLSCLEFKPYIMRGFLYYTGTVFELFDIGSKENPRALNGGGRYDDLLELFGKDKLPAVGLGWGSVTMMDFMKTYNLLPSSSTSVDVFACYFSPELYAETTKLVTLLRSNGVNVEQQITLTNLGKQLQYADKKKIPYVVILGPDEFEKNVVQLKELATGKSETLPVVDLIARLKKVL
jgi:histidyl-tRNA synthetase